MGPFLCFIKKWHYLLRSTVYTAFHLIPVKWNKLLYNFIFVRWGAFGQAAPQFLQLEHDCKLKITHTVDCISKSFCKTTETQYKFVNLAAKSLDSLLAVRHHIHKCVRSQLGHCFLRFFSCHFHTLFFFCRCLPGEKCCGTDIPGGNVERSSRILYWSKKCNISPQNDV